MIDQNRWKLDLSADVRGREKVSGTYSGSLLDRFASPANGAGEEAAEGRVRMRLGIVAEGAAKDAGALFFNGPGDGLILAGELGLGREKTASGAGLDKAS